MSSAAPDLPPSLHLNDWFDRLDAAGLRAGVRERLLAHALLMRLAVQGRLPVDRAGRLRLIGPLVCSSAQQQRDYARLVDEVAHADASGSVVEPYKRRGGVGHADDARRVRSVRIWAAGLVLLALLLVGGWQAFGGKFLGLGAGAVPQESAASAPASAASGGAVQIAPDTAALAELSASAVAQPVYVPQRPLQWALPTLPAWAAPLRWSLAGLGGLALGFLVWRLWRHWQRRRPYLDAAYTDRDPVEERLLRDAERDVAPVGPGPAVLMPVTRALRQRMDSGRAVLDVRATIAATIQQGGRALRPVMRAAQETPEYLALVERTGADDHQARYHEAVVRALQARGVVVELYFYAHSPEYGVWRLGRAAGGDDGGHAARPVQARIGFAALQVRHPRHRLLVFGDARGALDPDTGEVQPWATAARHHFAQRAWFTPLPVANWDRAEAWVAQTAGLDFLLLPMEEAALTTLADWLGSGRARLVQHPQAPWRFPPLIKGHELDWAVRRVAPPAEVLAALMGELRSYLGPKRMQWLAACAVFPALAWPLTLALGRRVIEDDGERAVGLAALGALPWFRQGRMPGWLREALLAQMDEATLADLRAQVLARLDKAVDPQAADEGGEVLARISRTRATVRQWLTGRRGQARDLLLVRFLEPALAPKLVQRLPEVFKRGLFRQGSALLGLRGWVEVAAVVPLLAGVAAWPGVWDRVGPGKEMTAVAAQQWPVGAGAVKALGVSADGWQICTRSADDTVRRWRASTGAAVTGDGWCAETVEATRATRPDGQQVAQVANGRITVTMSPDGQQVAQVENGRITLTTTARSNAVSTTVAGRPGTVLTNQATVTYSAELAQADVTALAYSPDGSQLASAGADGRVSVWDITTTKQIKTLATGTTAWRSVAYSLNGQRILAADAAGRLQVWDVLTGDLVTAVSAPTLAGGDIQARFAADGSALFAAGQDGQVHRWGAAPPQAVAVLGCVTTDAVPRVDATARAQADRLANPKAADKLPALAPVAYTPAVWQTLGHGTAQQIPAKREILVPANQPEALATARTLAAWLSQETPTQAAWTVRTSEAALSMPTLSTCDVTLPEPPKPPEPQLDPVAWPQAAADAARDSQLQTALNAVFSANRASRVQATQKVIADADLVSDLLPMALQRALSIESGAASGAGSSDARSRVIQTLTLAQSATPVTQQRHATTIYRLLDSLKDNGALAETESAALRKILLAAKGKKPLVYLQIANEKQRASAVKLQAELKKIGFDAPGVANIGNKAPDQAELRVRGRSDQALARWVLSAVEKMVGLKTTSVLLNNFNPANDVYEICYPGDGVNAEYSAVRVALLIGNDNYKNIPSLMTSYKNLDLIGSSLVGVGFKVKRGYNFDKLKMEEAISEFIIESARAEVSFIYFSGHGFTSLDNESYLMPIDVKAENDLSLANGSINLNNLMRQFGLIKAPLNLRLVVVDADFYNGSNGLLNKNSIAVSIPDGSGSTLVGIFSNIYTAKDIRPNVMVSPYATVLSKRIALSSKVSVHDIFSGIDDEIKYISDRKANIITLSNFSDKMFLSGEVVKK